MSLYTFESEASLPEGQYRSVVNSFDPAKGASSESRPLAPSFRLGSIGCRVGMIICTAVEENEFAGVLCVGHDDRDQKAYGRLLRAAALPSTIDVLSVSCATHLIAGTRIADTRNGFATTSIVSDDLVKKGQKRVVSRYKDLVTISPYNFDEFQITPQDIYELARLVKPARAV